MNVYDEAHNLEKAIKESQEFKDYIALKAKITANPDLEAMLKDYQAKQMEIQTKQMMGEELGEDMVKSVQGIYEIMAKDPTAAEYLQAEMRFAMMMNDVYKILGEAVQGA
ncbi:MAG: YlbF family regulator [Anaerovoracaceae bacterium]